MKQTQEFYVVDPNTRVDIMNPVRNIFLIPLGHKFKVIQCEEGGKVIYKQVTRYFREVDNA